MLPGNPMGGCSPCTKKSHQLSAGVAGVVSRYTCEDPRRLPPLALGVRDSTGNVPVGPPTPPGGDVDGPIQSTPGPHRSPQRGTSETRLTRGPRIEYKGGARATQGPKRPRIILGPALPVLLLAFCLVGPAISPQSAASARPGRRARCLELYLLAPIRRHRAQLALPENKKQAPIHALLSLR